MAPNGNYRMKGSSEFGVSKGRSRRFAVKEWMNYDMMLLWFCKWKVKEFDSCRRDKFLDSDNLI